MNIRFYNAKILTMQEPLEVIKGELCVSGNRIVYVGAERAAEKGTAPDEAVYNMPADIQWDREIDCEGNLLMPGFKDAHTHSPMVLFRSMADDLPLQDWLNHRIFPIEAKLTGQDTYELTKLAVLEYLTSGITAVFDMYVTPDTIQDAFIECGMRSVLVSGLNDFVLSVEKIEEYYHALNEKSALSSFRLGVHAEYTCSLDLLEKTAKLVQKYKAPFFAHICETEKEVKDCFHKYGKTPYELFCDLGLYDYGGGGYHGIYVNRHDIELMKDRHLAVVTNPASNLKLASGIAPISTYLKEGVLLAIGTDGAGSNNCLDMFREMFLVTALAKYKDGDAKSVDATEVLKMATVGGALAMGLDECDTLEVGKYADLILIDLHQPNMQPLNNIPKNLVYSGSKQNVKLTMIDGKILYEDGKFDLPFLAEEIFKKANAITARVR